MRVKQIHFDVFGIGADALAWLEKYNSNPPKPDHIKHRNGRVFFHYDDRYIALKFLTEFNQYISKTNLAEYIQLDMDLLALIECGTADQKFEELQSKLEQEQISNE